MEKRFKRSRLSWYKQDRLLEYFIAGSTARFVSQLLGFINKTAAFYFRRLREIIAYELEQESACFFSGEIEVNERYFGGRRKGRRRRDAKGKTLVFGLLKECEWRFNHCNLKKQKKQLKQWANKYLRWLYGTAQYFIIRSPRYV